MHTSPNSKLETEWIWDFVHHSAVLTGDQLVECQIQSLRTPLCLRHKQNASFNKTVKYVQEA